MSSKTQQQARQHKPEPAEGLPLQAPPGSSGTNATSVGLIVAVIVVLITLLYFLTRGRKKGRTVLLVGASDVGKTALFGKLWQKKNVDTVTSIQPNFGDFEPGNGKAALLLKDLPGNDRVRQKHWEDNRSGVRGVICVVDAAAGGKAIRDAADVLYCVLTDSVVTSLKPNILVFANKQDLPTSKGIKVVKSALEREITTLRMTKSASLQSTSNSSTAAKALGRLDKDFEFEQLAPLKVEFAEGISNSDNLGDVQPVIDWLKKIA